MTKNLYAAWVNNDSGASAPIGKFTNIRAAESAARAEFGSGWTVHIEKIWIDGDGQSWNPEANEEVKTFRIR